MSKAIIAVVAIIAVIAAGVLIYHEVSERPEYHVDDMHEAVGLVTFTASAELDEAATVTVWAGDTEMSMLGIDEWTASAGSWEQTFIMTLPEGMTMEEFDDCLEIHFDGKAGWRRR